MRRVDAALLRGGCCEVEQRDPAADIFISDAASDLCSAMEVSMRFAFAYDDDRARESQVGIDPCSRVLLRCVQCGRCCCADLHCERAESLRAGGIAAEVDQCARPQVLARDPVAEGPAVWFTRGCRMQYA